MPSPLGAGSSVQEQWMVHEATDLNRMNINVLSFGKNISHSVFAHQKGGAGAEAMYLGSIQLPSRYGAYVVQVLYESPGYGVLEKRLPIYIQPSNAYSWTWLQCAAACVVLLVAPVGWSVGVQ